MLLYTVMVQRTIKSSDKKHLSSPILRSIITIVVVASLLTVTGIGPATFVNAFTACNVPNTCNGGNGYANGGGAGDGGKGGKGGELPSSSSSKIPSTLGGASDASNGGNANGGDANGGIAHGGSPLIACIGLCH